MKTMYYKVRAWLLGNDINLDNVKIGIFISIVLLGSIMSLVRHPEFNTHSIGSSEVVEVCYVRDGSVVGVQNDQGFDYLAKIVSTDVELSQCKYSIQVL